MRYIVTIILLFVTVSLFAQTDAKLQQACSALNTALLSKDTVAIKKLVDSKIQYGHSNGWIQTRQDIINDLYSGKLNYTEITPSDVQMNRYGNVACVRSVTNLSATMNGNAMQFKLSVLQVWMKDKAGWVLIARQSGKL